MNEKSFLEVFADLQIAKENIVYLTSDSPNELSDFDDSKVYIIGGLVDHNHHKSFCYDLAVKNGLSHGRLPIGKFLSMKTRSVLTVNQVFQIVCKYTECRDWQKAFVSTLPKRKGAEVLAEGSEHDSDSPVAVKQMRKEEETKGTNKLENTCINDNKSQQEPTEKT